MSFGPDDYITIKPSVSYHHFNVVIMMHDRRMDEYVVFRCSQAMKEHPAKALADNWKSATGLEIR